MENLPEQDLQKSPKNFVHIIAQISLIIFFIAEITILILAALKILSWLTWLYFSISSIIELILLFSLDNAIKRITILENVLLEKGVIEKKELNMNDVTEKENFNDTDGTAKDTDNIDLEAEGITFCKECNYQLFPEDEVCPYCGAKVDNNNK
ncbi:MAG: zinc ribbon domain-containing protein [Clostridia bacterium]|nr:zinc ribbon domain-containing protein [Clostridia bacterium]